MFFLLFRLSSQNMVEPKLFLKYGILGGACEDKKQPPHLRHTIAMEQEQDLSVEHFLFVLSFHLCFSSARVCCLWYPVTSLFISSNPYNSFSFRFALVAALMYAIHPEIYPVMPLYRRL